MIWLKTQRQADNAWTKRTRMGCMPVIAGCSLETAGCNLGIAGCLDLLDLGQNYQADSLQD
jgi:hypothetical protein